MLRPNYLEQLSTSSESTRIAGLVAAVDERVDRLEDALEYSNASSGLVIGARIRIS